MLEVGQPIIHALILDADNQAGFMLDDKSQVEHALVLDRNNQEGHVCLDAIVNNQVGLIPSGTSAWMLIQTAKQVSTLVAYFALYIGSSQIARCDCSRDAAGQCCIP